MGLTASNEAELNAEFEARRDAPTAPAAPAHEPAWLRFQREAAEPEPTRSIDVPDGTLAADAAEVAPAELPAAAVPASEQPAQQAQATESQAETQPTAVQEAAVQATFDMPVQAPATPWPPLGASWPAREKPGAP